MIQIHKLEKYFGSSRKTEMPCPEDVIFLFASSYFIATVSDGMKSNPQAKLFLEL